MTEELVARSGVGLLSQIEEEEPGSKEHSQCFLLLTGPAGGPGDGGNPQVAMAEIQDVEDSPPVCEQQKKTEDRSLLEELGRIEAELRESLQLDEARQKEAHFLRQQENQALRSNLLFLSLNQRLTKPWVSSYFRKFPMHLYCLPVCPAIRRVRRRGLSKKK